MKKPPAGGCSDQGSGSAAERRIRRQHGFRRLGQQVGVVTAVMQASAFLAQQRGADDQFGGLHQVAQFDQVVADVEVAVILVDLAFQQVDPVQRALQPLIGADDAT